MNASWFFDSLFPQKAPGAPAAYAPRPPHQEPLPRFKPRKRRPQDFGIDRANVFTFDIVSPLHHQQIAPSSPAASAYHRSPSPLSPSPCHWTLAITIAQLIHPPVRLSSNMSTSVGVNVRLRQQCFCILILEATSMLYPALQTRI